MGEDDAAHRLLGHVQRIAPTGLQLEMNRLTSERVPLHPVDVDQSKACRGAVSIRHVFTEPLALYHAIVVARWDSGTMST